MAVLPDSPITGRAWKSWMRTLARHAPMRLGQIVEAGKAMRALAASRKPH